MRRLRAFFEFDADTVVAVVVASGGGGAVRVRVRFGSAITWSLNSFEMRVEALKLNSAPGSMLGMNDEVGIGLALTVGSVSSLERFLSAFTDAGLLLFFICW